jgi:Uma2 family endonuclease
MSVTIAPPIVEETAPASLPAPDSGIRVRRWTREEFYRAAEVGLFGPEEHLELIEGEVIEKLGENPPHVLALKLMEAALARTFALVDCHLHSQHPISLPDGSEPEPDVAVIARGIRQYLNRHPLPEEVLLIVEVSNTTLAFDRARKAALYATAGIPEYWLLNLIDRRLEVHREPLNGVYQNILLLAATQSVAPLSVPETPIAVADLLP